MSTFLHNSKCQSWSACNCQNYQGMYPPTSPGLHHQASFTLSSMLPAGLQDPRVLHFWSRARHLFNRGKTEAREGQRVMDALSVTSSSCFCTFGFVSSQKDSVTAVQWPNILSQHHTDTKSRGWNLPAGPLPRGPWPMHAALFVNHLDLETGR